MLRLIDFDEDLDLSFFYKECDKKGWKNNNSQKRIYDKFKKYDKHNTWILYEEMLPVGSVVAHSFDEYEKGSFRVLATTCVLEEFTTYNSLGHVEEFKRHQHITARFYIPKMIEWCGINNNMYITTHPDEVGQMKKVHTFVMRMWTRWGLVEKKEDITYRDAKQSVWKLNAKEWLYQLDKYPIERDFLKTI